MKQDATSALRLHLNHLEGKAVEVVGNIVELISHSSTKEGLAVAAVVDQNLYFLGIKVADEEMGRLNVQRAGFHPEWNYTLIPRTPA